MLSSRTQKWWAIGAGLSVVLLAASWFLLISPRRGSVTDLELQAEQLQSQTSQQQVRTAQLKAALAELPKKKAELAVIQTQLPKDADIPKTITDMEGFAGSAGVTLNQLTPGSPAVAGAAVAGVTSTAAATATKPVLVQVPISIQATGDYFQSALFLKSLQSTMSRSILIQSIQVAGSSNAATTPAGSTTTTTGTSAGTSTGTTAGTTGATAAPTAAATTPATTAVSMTITGQLFVLLDGTNTLADVKKDAAKATS